MPPQYGIPQYGYRSTDTAVRIPQYGIPQYGPPQYGPPQSPAGGHGYPAAPRRRLAEPVIGWLLLGVSVLTAVSAALPWARVLGISVAGTRGDGEITIFCAAVLAVLGILIGLGQGRLWVLITACVFAAFVTLVGLADIGNVSRIANDANRTVFGKDAVSVGAGLWLTLVAGLAALALSVV